MKKIVIGILAHVDSGKTTLSEGMLYCAGEIRKLGRVDHRDAFLDTDEIERERGITIFSKQAVLNLGDTVITLLDTPGHVDFSAETERTLQVLDYCILVISGSDGVQSHTETLWKLLQKHNVPTFLFINKLDLPGTDKAKVLNSLRSRLSDACTDFCQEDKTELLESIALHDETAMNEFIEQETLSDKTVQDLITRRSIFPVYSGSALKTQGVQEFLNALKLYTKMPHTSSEFGAKVYKISEDERGQRLTHIKVTGGVLRVKDLIFQKSQSEKVNEVRIYSGQKYKTATKADAGTVCALTGLTETYSGEGLGFEADASGPILEPIFTYKINYGTTDAHTALLNIKKLEEEDKQLHVLWNEQLREIHLQLMGEVQLEVLQKLIAKRFSMQVTFEQGSLIYKETIAEKVEGVGHYEPLRHYAEVHLLLEPLKAGSGLKFATDCKDEILARSWQRLIMTHLQEKTHLGVLTGSPITDMKITLKSGRAHLKHTEGGDFRQATYRAVRHGLMNAKSILLEPWYSFEIEVPTENIGRVMTDLEQMGAEFDAPENKALLSCITGSAPVSAIADYQKTLVEFTHGKGRMLCSVSGYAPCKNSDTVIEKISYNSEGDLENTADSVFCAHGAGFVVKWNEVAEYMHLESVLKPEIASMSPLNISKSMNTIAGDDELMQIFERTYGKIKRENPNALYTPKPKKAGVTARKVTFPNKKEYLLIDGYNIIFAWKDLKETAKESLEQARFELIKRMSGYQIFRQCEIIIVFDAYKVKGNRGEIEKHDNITVVYTKEAETADTYIEKATHELSKQHKVQVATSDAAEQMIIFGNGAYRLPASALEQEVEDAEKQIRAFLNTYSKSHNNFLRIPQNKYKSVPKENHLI